MLGQMCAATGWSRATNCLKSTTCRDHWPLCICQWPLCICHRLVNGYNIDWIKLISRRLLPFFVEGSVVSVPFCVQLYVFLKKHVTEIFLKPRFPPHKFFKIFVQILWDQRRNSILLVAYGAQESYCPRHLELKRIHSSKTGPVGSWAWVEPYGALRNRGPLRLLMESEIDFP